MPQTQTRRPWLAKLILLGLSVGVAVLMMEVIVRVAGMDSPLVWEPDPVFGWWHVPGSEQHWTSEGDGWVHINSLKLRDPERTLAKPKDVLRIAIFGDSMTEGVQVNLDRTFTQLLEKRLAATLGRPVEVWNYGVNGYGTLQQYLLFKDQAPKIKPDLVIHAVFLDNDVADLHPGLALGQGERGAPFATVATDGQLQIDYSKAEASYRDYNTQPIAFIRRTSALYRAISIARWQLIAARYSRGSVAGTGIPRRFFLYADPAPKEWDAAWQIFDAVVARFAADASQMGIKYALLSVPPGQLVNPEAWQEVQREFPAMLSATWNLDGPEKRFREIASRHGIPLITPFERFASAPDRRDLYYGVIGHFTPAGHRLMTNILEQELNRLSLIP